MKYLLDNKEMPRYDSYLWGSSRVMKTDTFIASKSTYNMGSSIGLVDNCLHDLQLLLKEGIPVKVVYLGIDDFTYNADYQGLQTALYRRLYEADEWKNYQYYAELLFSLRTIPNGISLMNHKWVKNEGIAKNAIGYNGMYIVPERIEQEIEERPEQYVQLEKFRRPTINGSGSERLWSCLSKIKEIAQICRENHIKFVPFFNPQHMTTYLADDMELMNRFKKELAKISPFWDFSGVNYVTTNNYFWYETSHPRAFICDKILDMVSGQNQMAWVPDFGVYVTPENVDAFCEKAVRDREAYDPNHEQWIPTAEERAVMSRRLHIH